MNDSEIITFATEFREGILGGRPSDMMCFMVVAPLATLLGLHGVDATIQKAGIGVCDHFFLELPDGRVLDPTADQFNWCSDSQMPPVYLGEPTIIHTDYTKAKAPVSSEAPEALGNSANQRD